MTRKQVSVQLSQELLNRLDERAVREGRSRSALISDAIEAFVPDEKRRQEEYEQVTREIVEGYERIPETEAELAGARARTRQMIEEEPW